MYELQKLELWNISPDVPALFGAQKIFNIVGRLKSPDSTVRFLYSLNGGPDRKVFFNSGLGRCGRLQHPGDFNIDTISDSELQPVNSLCFKVVDTHQVTHVDEVNFPAIRHPQTRPRIALNLQRVEHAQQVGQLVDGKWKVNHDPGENACLEIKKEDAGLDRIILFGHGDWKSGYTISARLCVTAWTDTPYNVGLLFKWNDHMQGDGTCLPTQWSTGLAYYSSYDPGLRIRFGVDVHVDTFGNKVGDYVLCDGRLSLYRYWAKRFLNSRWGRRIPRKLLPFDFPFAEISPRTCYTFKMHVHPEHYALTVWPSSKKEPQPQLYVSNPIEYLGEGSVGVIAYNCAVKVYSFRVDDE